MIEIFKKASLCRNFENETYKQIQQKNITFPTYLSAGQEYIASSLSHYLEKHNLSEEVVETVRYHNTPSRAPNYAKNAAAVHIADVLLRASGIPDIEKTGTIPESKWTRLAAWRILFGTDNSEARLSIASLKHTLNRMPQMLKEMV